MRENIGKYRGKSNGEWVYGFYYQRQNPKTEDGQPIEHFITNCPPFCYQVDPSTVGEYTGLKDKNDMKIYEGDVLGREANWDETIYHKDAAFYHRHVDFVEGYVLTRDFAAAYEVIGNIHEERQLQGGKGENQ